jgi:hypothetical protein
MMKTIARICLALFLAAVPFLFYGYGVETLRVVSKISLGDRRWTAFLLGAAVFFPCLFLARRIFPSLWSYLETLEHELTHLLIGLVFLKIPVGIRVSAHEGGEVRQIGRGTTGETWVTLAPYFFPTVSLAVLAAAYPIGLETGLLLGVLGWTTAFHLISNWGETSFRQPDLQKAGVLKTILIMPVMNLICYGAVLSYVAGGAKGFGGFGVGGLRGAGGLILEIWRRL